MHNYSISSLFKTKGPSYSHNAAPLSRPTVKSYNSITAMMDSIKKQRSNNPPITAKKHYKSKTYGHAAIAVVKMQKIAKRAGIYRRKTKQNISALKEEKNACLTRLKTINNRQAQIKIDKESVRSTMKKVLESNIIEPRLCVVYMNEEEALRKESKALKAETVKITKQMLLLNTKIAAEEELLQNITSTFTKPEEKISISPVMEKSEPKETNHEAEVISKKIVDSPTISPRTVIDIPEKTSRRLSVYLRKIEKTGLLGLAMSKKELQREAEGLSSELSFTEYMHAVQSTPGARDSLINILNEPKKASTVLVQLQKKLQREWGTYPKEFDRSIILPETKREEIIESYALQHSLDSTRLKSLINEVANATAKDREVKTKNLTAYMTGF